MSLGSIRERQRDLDTRAYGKFPFRSYEDRPVPERPKCNWESLTLAKATEREMAPFSNSFNSTAEAAE